MKSARRDDGEEDVDDAGEEVEGSRSSEENGSARSGFDSDSASGSESGSDDEDDDEEPIRHQRLGGMLSSIVSDPGEKDASSSNFPKGHSVSCMHLHKKMVILATYDGTVWFVDHMTGNQLRPPMKVHKQRVTCVSADLAGSYVATSSDDGRVCVINASTGEHNTYNYYNPVTLYAWTLFTASGAGKTLL